jgi:hypothetical protein
VGHTEIFLSFFRLSELVLSFYFFLQSYFSSFILYLFFIPRRKEDQLLCHAFCGFRRILLTYVRTAERIMPLRLPFPPLPVNLSFDAINSKIMSRC